MFIVVWWATNRWGYQTFDNDFNAAMREMDRNLGHVEVWWFDQDYRTWYRINFANNDKHVPYSPPIG